MAMARLHVLVLLLLLPLGLVQAFVPFQHRATPPRLSSAGALGSGGGSSKDVGKILGPGSAGGWDDYKVSGPVVRAGPEGQGWNLFYYGRSLQFNQTADLINLPSGYIGLARSSDGLSFRRVAGPVAGGAVFGPSEAGKGAFDDLHVGIGDVQWDAQTNKWVMYYFGGDGSYGPTPYGKARGIYMKIGSAESADGVNWTRRPGVLLDKGGEGDFDALFVGWPQVVDLSPVSPTAPLAWGMHRGILGMYYHTFNAQTFGFEIGLATSKDGGKSWQKQGPCQITRGAPGSHRDLGHATRCVVPDPAGRKKLLMFAECANTQNSNCIAVYGSDDGLRWEDMHAADAPAYRGAGLGTGRWDAQALGCPSVIVRDGRFFMYYVGFTESSSEGAALGCIGLAVSDGMDFTKWRRMGE